MVTQIWKHRHEWENNTKIWGDGMHLTGPGWSFVADFYDCYNESLIP